MYGEGAVTNGTCQKWFVKFLVLLTFGPNNPLLWGCLMHWKMFSSSPGLYPLEANSGRWPTYSKYPNQYHYWGKQKIFSILWKNEMDFLARPIDETVKGRRGQHVNAGSNSSGNTESGVSS